MVNMIDVIIPAYNAHDTIEFTLMSLAMQKINNKLNIYIVDDASNYSYDEIIKRFSKELTIKLLKLDNNSGSGLAREYGINNSNSEYIFFIDADDLLLNPESLQNLYDNIDNYDYVYGKIYSEEQGIIKYTYGDLHGKLYRREFLTNNDIHFNNTRYHEDNAFNSLVRLHKPRTKQIEAVIYFYSYNKKSITHDSEELQFKRNEIYIDNMNYVVISAKSHGCEEDLIKEYLFTKYKYLVSVSHDVNNEKKQQLKDWLSKYKFNDYIKQFDSASLQEIEELL